MIRVLRGAPLGALVLVLLACNPTPPVTTTVSTSSECDGSCGMCPEECGSLESCVNGKLKCECDCPDECGPNACGACPPGCSAVDACVGGEWQCSCMCPETTGSTSETGTSDGSTTATATTDTSTSGASTTQSSTTDG